MKNGIFGRTIILRLVWPAAMVAIGAIVSLVSGPAFGGTIEQIARKNLSLEDRAKLTCPDPNAAGVFSTPVEILPSPKMAMWITYSQESDLIRLANEETEVTMDLAGGDDIALLYNVGAGARIVGGVGADTIFLCSMVDLGVAITLGPESLMRDSDRDVVIIESSVFSNIPAGMGRDISIYGFNPDNDRLVIRAPAELLQRREASAQIGGIRIGDVFVTILVPIGNEKLDYDDEAIILVPDGQ